MNDWAQEHRDAMLAQGGSVNAPKASNAPPASYATNGFKPYRPPSTPDRSTVIAGHGGEAAMEATYKQGGWRLNKPTYVEPIWRPESPQGKAAAAAALAAQKAKPVVQALRQKSLNPNGIRRNANTFAGAKAAPAGGVRSGRVTTAVAK